MNFIQIGVENLFDIKGSLVWIFQNDFVMCAGYNYLGYFVAFGIFHVGFLPLGVKKINDERSRQKHRLEKYNWKKIWGRKKNLSQIFGRKKIGRDFFYVLRFFFSWNFPVYILALTFCYKFFSPSKKGLMLLFMDMKEFLMVCTT